MENMNYETGTYESEVVTGKKRKAKQTKGGDKKLVAALVALICAFVIFIVMLTVQKYIINSEETKSVIVATVDVPKGVVLTEENMLNYFSMEQRPVSDLPENTFSTGHALTGKITGCEIYAHQVVTDNLIIAENFYEGIEDPVEISIEVEKIGQAVAGTLRAGDVIDLKLVVDVEQEGSYYDGVPSDVALTDVPEIGIMDGLDNAGTITGETGDVSDLVGGESADAVNEYLGGLEGIGSYDMMSNNTLLIDGLSYNVTGRYGCATIAENVHVTSVYTSAGLGTKEAEELEGSSQVATVINVVIPRSMEDVICLAQEEGTLRLSRVITPVSEEENVENIEETTVVDYQSAVSGVLEENGTTESTTEVTAESTVEATTETIAAGSN